MSLPILWTATLQNNPKEKKALEDSIYSNPLILKRLQEIIEEKTKALDNREYLPSSYKEAGWSHAQAHINGQRATLAEFKQLLTITK